MAGKNLSLARKYYGPTSDNLEQSDSDESYYEDQLDTDSPTLKAQKREHHNQLERKRRNGIKDAFEGLKNAVITVRPEVKRGLSRMQILKKSAEYIRETEESVMGLEQDNDELKQQNLNLLEQIRTLATRITPAQLRELELEEFINDSSSESNSNSGSDSESHSFPGSGSETSSGSTT